MKEGWTYKKLGEVASFIGDGDWIESRHQSDSGIRLIQTGNIGNGFFKAKEDKPHFISEETFNELACTEIFKGDCLVSRLPDPIGRACIIPDIGCRMITAVDCTIIRFKEIVCPQLFVYYTGSKKYEREIGNHTTGSTRKRISRKNLELVKIPVPSLETQQHVVSELDLLQSIIDKQKAQLKELDNLAQAVFYDMFGDILKAVPKYTLKDVASYFIGLTYKPTEVSDAGTIVLRSSNIQENQLDFQDIVRVNTKVDKKKIVEEGDILMCSRNGSSRLVGKVARIKNLSEQMSFGAFMTIIKSQYNDYLFYYFLSQYFRSQLITSQTATINQITTKMLDDIKLNVPPLTLQQSFASKIESIEKQKSAIGKSIEETQKLFDYTMDKYFG